MAKISPSPLPPANDRRPRGKQAEPDAFGGPRAGADAVTTLGEAQAREGELREAFSPADAGHTEDSQTDREEKKQSDARFRQKERVEAKQPGPRPGGKGAAASRAQEDGPLAALGRRTGSDGFELGGPGRTQARPRLDAPSPLGAHAVPTPRPRTQSGAMYILNNAKEPGVYFREDGHDDGRAPEESDDPELAEAVEECIRLLFGVRGILRVGPGVNDKGDRVIVIVPHRGFTQSSMRAIPERVHRFKTLVAVPFDLLPLRRD